MTLFSPYWNIRVSQFEEIWKFRLNIEFHQFCIFALEYYPFLQNCKNFKNGPPLKIYFTKWPSFVSGSPLAATTTATTSSTPFSTSTSNILDRLSLPPYKPNHLPQKAEELLKTLVNPIGKRMKLDFHFIYCNQYLFFRFWTVRRIFASRKFPRIWTLFWSPSYKKCDCTERSNNKSHLQSPSTWKSHGMITFDYF